MSSPEQKVIKQDGVWVIEGRPRETIKFISHERPPNIPGKSIITLLLTLPPNGATPPHTHSGAALTGLMIRGKMLNQMNCEEPRVYEAGQTFFEPPGCHHIRGENPSQTEEAALYALFIIDDDVVENKGFEGLAVMDAEVEEARKLEAEKSA